MWLTIADIGGHNDVSSVVRSAFFIFISALQFPWSLFEFEFLCRQIIAKLSFFVLIWSQLLKTSIFFLILR